MSELEASDINNASRRVKAEDKPTQMSMIGETGADADEVCAGVIAELAKMDADRMTPMEALSKLYELSSRVKIAKTETGRLSSAPNSFDFRYYAA